MYLTGEPGQAAARLAVWLVPVISPSSEVLCPRAPHLRDSRNGGLSVAVPLELGRYCSFAQQSKKGKVSFHVGVAF